MVCGSFSMASHSARVSRSQSADGHGGMVGKFAGRLLAMIIR